MRFIRKKENEWHGALLSRSFIKNKRREGRKILYRKKRFRRILAKSRAYFIKMRGSRPSPYEFSFIDTCWSFLGGFFGMLVLAVLNISVLGRHDQVLMLGSFGASAMLVFGAPHAPFAQPRNVLGGHVVSALIGVWVQGHLGATPWLAAALAVALAIALMQMTATLHPPGGATALIAVVGGEELKSFGYSYAFMPVAVSAAALIAVGIIINNLSRKRRYPLYWW